jgi:hypothetical protein
MEDRAVSILDLPFSSSPLASSLQSVELGGEGTSDCGTSRRNACGFRMATLPAAGALGERRLLQISRRVRRALHDRRDLAVVRFA